MSDGGGKEGDRRDKETGGEGRREGREERRRGKEGRVGGRRDGGDGEGAKPVFFQQAVTPKEDEVTVVVFSHVISLLQRLHGHT